MIIMIKLGYRPVNLKGWSHGHSVEWKGLGGVLRNTPDGMVMINNQARAMHLVDLTGMGGREALLIYGMVVSYHQARVSSCQPEGPWVGETLLMAW
jgi:hypothetical protein